MSSYSPTIFSHPPCPLPGGEFGIVSVLGSPLTPLPAPGDVWRCWYCTQYYRFTGGSFWAPSMHWRTITTRKGKSLLRRGKASLMKWER